MHETMAAQSILDTICKEAEKLGRRPISARISCGQLIPINAEVLNFAYQAISKGTPGEGMRLDVVQVAMRASCNNCGQTFDFDVYSPGCDKCQGKDFRFEPDAPLMLEEIEFEDDG